VALACAGGAGPARAGDVQPPQVYGDGVRYAAWQARPDVVHVIDDRGPDFAVPTPPGCTTAGLGGGRLLFDCRPAGDEDRRVAHGVVVDLARRRAAPLSAFFGNRPGSAGLDARFVAVGRQWTAISLSSYHVQYLAYMRLDGSRALTVPDRPRRRPARVVPDLDEPGLWQHLCGGLRVPLDPAYDPIDELSDPLLPFSYQRPFLLIQRRAAGTTGHLLLRRCGRLGPVVLSRCDEGCTGWSLVGGRAIWFDLARRLHLYGLRSRSEVVWRLRGGASVIAVTGRLAVLATRSGRVLTRRLPGAGGGPAARAPGP
jgi:hypothetical protein